MVLKSQKSIYLEIDSPTISPDEKVWIEELGVKTLFFIPLIYRRQTIGLVEIGRIHTLEPVTASELRLAETMTAQAAVAIEHARLYDEATRHLAEAKVFYTLGKYLQLLVFPYILTHDYYPRHIEVMDFADWGALLSLALYLAMLVYALRQLPRKDPVSFAILYYLATLSIVSNLLFPVGTHMAERLMFMPSVGFCLLLALLGYRWAAASVPKGKEPAFRQFMPALAVLAAVCLAYAARTVVRNPAWADNYTLFTTDIQYSPNSAKLPACK